MAKFAPHMGDPQWRPADQPTTPRSTWISCMVFFKKANKCMWIGVLWAGLRVAMWITHVGGKFRHGLLEKSLNKIYVCSPFWLECRLMRCAKGIFAKGILGCTRFPLLRWAKGSETPSCGLRLPRSSCSDLENEGVSDPFPYRKRESQTLFPTAKGKTPYIPKSPSLRAQRLKKFKIALRD